jgi:capsular exopolysaccharide synthesis family protein
VSQSFSDFDQPGESQSSGGLDFKRVAYRAIRHWYIVVISLGIALTVAFYKNRYTQRIYPVTASILIRETKETGGAELLYKNALIDPYRNYLNEPYIIRSYPLLERVVRENNFQISFYREGFFMTTESYSYIPVKAEWCRPGEAPSGRFVFTLKDEQHFELRPSMDDKADAKVFAMNDSIEYKGFHLCIRRIPDREISQFIDIPFYILIQNPRTVAGSYIGRLSVKWAEEGSGVINLGINGSDPEKEMDFLTHLIQAYRQADLEKKNETAERTIEFIKDQLAGIKDSLRTVEYQLERFGNSSRVKDMSMEAQRLLTKLEGFEIQKAELLVRQNYYQYLEDYLSKGNNYDQVILPASVGINDEVLNAMLKKMVDLQLEIKLYLNQERSSNPLINNKVDRINEVKRDIRESLGTLQSTDRIKMDFIRKQTQQTEKQLSSLPSAERQLISVQRSYALLENLYVFLMQKLSEAGISKASNVSDIIPVNPPIRGAAISPQPAQNYSMALILGLAIPLIVFIVLEVLNNKVQSKEDIEKMTTIPFIGGVGHNASGNNLIVSERPKSGVAESFRALRSNLNYFTGNKSGQVFMVTSSISGEGKTFTTINLATVFALSGRKTLIVGADMRRPKIFEDFGCSNEQGLSTYLSKLSDFDHIVQKTSIDNLALVSGGPVPPNPSELLLTDRFEMFIKIALERFEYVLIDTPPLALVTDAFVMSKHAHHTVFVMRQNYSPREFVKSINEYYKTGKLKNMSILLNDIYKSGLGYGYGQGYAYQYGYSYGYGYSSRRRNGNGYYEE